MVKFKLKKAQVALEYLLLLSVLLLVLLASLAKDSSVLRAGINEYVDELGSSIADIINKEE